MIKVNIFVDICMLFFCMFIMVLEILIFIGFMIDLMLNGFFSRFVIKSIVFVKI